MGRQVYTVSSLTDNIKAILENKFPFIWLSGEISNFRIPASGHFYFSLKDKKAQISAVMFRNQNRNLKFDPEDGMRITGLGRISVYQPRGTYQIILEYMEPKGIGALQKAFDQLKLKLQSQGYFDALHKKKIPFLPNKISVITSPTGAAIQDVINVIHRRHPDMAIEITPCSVQGDSAPDEIAEALNFVNEVSDSDLIILTRGGGSIEDLWAFNTEKVAKAVFNSKIPVISAVGHETDFTISDFVADLRAPTPSAAAELSTPVKAQIHHTIKTLMDKMTTQMIHRLDRHHHTLSDLSKKLVHPRKRIQDSRLRVDELSERSHQALKSIIYEKKQALHWSLQLFWVKTPKIRIQLFKDKLEVMRSNLSKYLVNYINIKTLWHQQTAARLFALNPESILKRGYSITKTIPDGWIVKAAGSVRIGQKLRIRLSQGAIIVSVKDLVINK